ncbi:hypothetical protein ACWA5Z_10770 [Testudinibacter sp. P80/BLE/0925]|uniref:hypothetical protein n=1 Tax=Testudinibacter sp. TW-1 TaxID=3417757 RepID=UPI003D36AD16
MKQNNHSASNNISINLFLSADLKLSAMERRPIVLLKLIADGELSELDTLNAGNILNARNEVNEIERLESFEFIRVKHAKANGRGEYTTYRVANKYQGEKLISAYNLKAKAKGYPPLTPIQIQTALNRFGERNPFIVADDERIVAKPKR